MADIYSGGQPTGQHAQMNGHNYEVMYNPATGIAWIGGPGQQQQVDPTQFGFKSAAQIQAGNQSAPAKPAAAPKPTDLGTKNVPGVGNVDVQRNPDGSYYYNQGGNRYLIDQNSLVTMGLPVQASRDANGQPYFYEPNVNANTGQTPEQNAISELAKTDPNFKAIMNNLSSYYNTQGQNLTDPNFVQNRQGQLLANQAKYDPNTAATTQSLGQNYAAMAANPGQLSDSVQRDVAQAARAAQAARGNMLGTSQAAQESLQSGLYGQQLQQQQMQMAQQWLGSGLTKTGQGQQLYNFNQGAQNQNAANAANYLGSGTTPIAVGSKYNNDIQNQANQASGTGTYYSPTQMGNPWTYLNPQAGPQFSQQSAQWYSMLPGQGGGAGGNPLGGALTGALSGAASGALAGSVIPGVGTGIGALGGALIGGLGGYGSSGGFCWVAREVYHVSNPKWIEFRDWLLTDAPTWFGKLYLRHGEWFALFIRNKPWLKRIVKWIFDKILEKRK